MSTKSESPPPPPSTSTTSTKETTTKETSSAIGNIFDMFKPFLPVIVIGIILFILVIWFLSTPLGQALSAALTGALGLLTAAMGWLTNCLGTWWCPLLIALCGIIGIVAYKSWGAAKEGGDKMVRTEDQKAAGEEVNEKAEQRGETKPPIPPDTIPTDDDVAKNAVNKVQAITAINDGKIVPGPIIEAQLKAQQSSELTKQTLNDPKSTTEEQEETTEQSNEDNYNESHMEETAVDSNFQKLPFPVQTMILNRQEQKIRNDFMLYKVGYASRVPIETHHWSNFMY